MKKLLKNEVCETREQWLGKKKGERNANVDPQTWIQTDTKGPLV